MSGNKKWWIIGCGGCLVSVIIVLVATGVLMVTGVSLISENNHKITREFFDEQPPEGFSPVIATSSGDVTFLMMFDDLQNQLVFSKYPIPEARFEELKQMTPRKAELLVGQGIAASQSFNPAKYQIMDTASITLNGQPYPIIRARAEMNKNSYIPAVFVYLLSPPDSLIFMIAQQPADVSQNPDDPFETEFAELMELVEDVATNTPLRKHILVYPLETPAPETPEEP